MPRQATGPRDTAQRPVGRTSRSAQTRDSNRRLSIRPAINDAVRSGLYIDPAVWPRGYTYRWIRVGVNGAVDNKNWSVKTRAGWKPVPRDRHPDLFPSLPMPGSNTTTQDVIMYGDLCLCERPTKDVLRDKQRQADETVAANDCVKDYVDGGSPNVPRFDQSGPVEYGYSRERAVDFKEDDVADE